MEWQRVEFRIPVQKGTDELGNELVSDYESKYYATRCMGWSNDDVLRYDIKVTDEYRQFLTEAPASVCQAADCVVFENEKYRIKEIVKFPRNRTLIHLRKIRHEDYN